MHFKMRRFTSRCSLVLSICCAIGFQGVGATTWGVQSGAAVPAVQPVVDSIDQYLRDVSAEGFSGVALIREKARDVLLRGYGFVDCERQRPMPPDAVMDIGSITKSMTAVAILDLVVAGKLSLNDVLPQFFDAVPTDKKQVTVEQLLRHTSGLPDSLGNDEDYVSKTWLVEHALATPLIATPGERVEYSNVGYSLLGAIIERVSGEPFERYVTDRQFSRVGLSRTGYTLPQWPIGSVACGTRDGKRYGATRDYFRTDGPSWHLMANGGIHSTASELADWFDALLAGKLLPTAALEVYTKAMIRTNSAGDLHYVAVSGSNEVFTADYYHFIEPDITLLIMTSNSQWPKEKVNRSVMDRLRPLLARRSAPSMSR